MRLTELRRSSLIYIERKQGRERAGSERGESVSVEGKDGNEYVNT